MVHGTFVDNIYQAKPFQPSFVFHKETSHMICNANQMSVFYMKCNTRLEWVNFSNTNQDSRTAVLRVAFQECIFHKNQ